MKTVILCISWFCFLSSASLKCNASTIYDSLSLGAKRIFDESMSLNEQLWDDVEGYLFVTDDGTPGVHDTRATAMWATALLARNGNNGTDKARAMRIFRAVSSQQYNDNSTVAWYGTFPHSPQEPIPGTSLLGTVPYADYDPNWCVRFLVKASIILGSVIGVILSGPPGCWPLKNSALRYQMTL
jgi:hypothetical protein